MASKDLNVAIVGCGNIAGPYAATLHPYEHIHLLGATDLDLERARALTAQYGGQVYESLDAVLADARVDLIVNLTIHHAHPEVITRCLNAGKHVHSEKPLAMIRSCGQSYQIRHPSIRRCAATQGAGRLHD